MKVAKHPKVGKILDDDLFILLNELLIASWTEPRAKFDYERVKKENGVVNRDFNATARLWVKERGGKIIRKPKNI